MRLAQPDWLAHRLVVQGPADAVARFQAAARGSGMVPWWWDYDALAEDWFHLLIAARYRTISVSGARALANALRDAVQQAHDLASSRIDQHRCAFDLHALLPVPASLLRRGADDPASLDWLWRHWGTTWPLRRVQVLVPELDRNTERAGGAVFCCRFHAADWTPWPALVSVRQRFPALQIAITPLYAA
jgi:hypothetical protein